MSGSTWTKVSLDDPEHYSNDTLSAPSTPFISHQPSSCKVSWTNRRLLSQPTPNSSEQLRRNISKLNVSPCEPIRADNTILSDGHLLICSPWTLKAGTFYL